MKLLEIKFGYMFTSDYFLEVISQLIHQIAQKVLGNMQPFREC